MAFNLIALPWLAEAAPDFRQQCKALSAETPDLGQRLSTLATAQLTSTQALTFARTLHRLAQDDLSPLVPFRVAVLASFTAEMIVDTLPAACARHGVAVWPSLADFDQIVQTLSDPDAACFEHGPKAALLLFDHRWLGLDRFVDAEDARGRVEAAIAQVQHCIALARDRGVQAIVPTLAVPPEPLLGSFDRLSSGTVRAQILAFNQALGALARDEGATLFDVAALAEQGGHRMLV